MTRPIAQLKSLEQAVTSQQVELHYYTVASPSNGIVGDIPVRVGDRVQVTTLLTTVDQPGPVEAYIYVPADRARNLRIGVPVHLVDTAGKDLGGFEDHVYFAAGRYGYADGAGEGDGREFASDTAHRAAGARAAHLGHASKAR